MKKPVPIMLVSDAPSAPTGLARITRDLAVRIASLPEFRVATLGKGGVGSRRFPFPQYVIPALPATEWGEHVIEAAWNDFARGEHGIIFTVWDASRLLWFARPEYAGDESLQRFLLSGHFTRWGYFPIDATGPAGRLTGMTRDTLLGYDRILTYTSWAQEQVVRTIGHDASAARGLDWLPHGIDTQVFTPRNKKESRAMLSPMLHEGDTLVGIVATNQARKDWGMALTACHFLRSRVKRLKVWIHTDLLERYWSIPALLADLGLTDVAIVTKPMDDETLSYAYSACDVTLAPGLGEGFGYPIAESLACGIPVVHGSYGGGAAITPTHLQVTPVAFRLDTLHNVVRPVYEPATWADKVCEILDSPLQNEACRASVEHLSWPLLWEGAWKGWLLEGVRTI